MIRRINGRLAKWVRVADCGEVGELWGDLDWRNKSDFQYANSGERFNEVLLCLFAHSCFCFVLGNIQGSIIDSDHGDYSHIFRWCLICYVWLLCLGGNCIHIYGDDLWYLLGQNLGLYGDQNCNSRLSYLAILNSYFKLVERIVKLQPALLKSLSTGSWWFDGKWAITSVTRINLESRPHKIQGWAICHVVYCLGCSSWYSDRCLGAHICYIYSESLGFWLSKPVSLLDVELISSNAGFRRHHKRSSSIISKRSVNQSKNTSVCVY